MKPAPFAYVRAGTLDDAIRVLDERGDSARILAGGQSLMATLNMRLSAPEVLVDIGRVAGLAGIEDAGDHLRIGAMTRHVDVETSGLVADHAPLLASAMPHIAHPAIRNRGTFGGSIAFADPAAELPACAVALGARMSIAGRDGTRTVEADAFFRGLYETAVGPGEILTAVEVPKIAPGWRSGFMELARRHGDYAIIGLAAHVAVEGGRFGVGRLVFFGAGDRPVSAARTAALLEGEAWSDALAARLADFAEGGARSLRGPQRRRRDAAASRGSARQADARAARLGLRGTPMETHVDVSMRVNGSAVTRRVEARMNLVDFLREELGLTGSHVGCEHGVCGACTVRVDGRIVRGCLTVAAQADGADVWTIEGLSDTGEIRVLQDAFVERNALQCGYCTPGMLLTAAELLARRPDADRAEIRRFISGNYCRCTGYEAIVDAVETARGSQGGDAP